MKQMIKNWKEIESLEDFIYFDKASGKVKIKKGVDIYGQTIPTFDVEMVEREGQITISMDEKYRNEIYTNKYPVVGFNIEVGETLITMCFKLKQYVPSANVVVYECWDYEDESATEIVIRECTFIWDGDSASIVYGETTFDLEPVIPVLHTHIIRLSKTNDSEDYPYITLNITSFASTYTKAEFEQYVKDVASFSSIQSMGNGLICVGDNGGYTNTKQGVFLLRYDTTSSTFIARQCENTTNAYNIDFGSTFPYFEISSH